MSGVANVDGFDFDKSVELCGTNLVAAVDRNFT